MTIHNWCLPIVPYCFVVVVLLLMIKNFFLITNKNFIITIRHSPSTQELYKGNTHYTLENRKTKTEIDSVHSHHSLQRS